MTHMHGTHRNEDRVGGREGMSYRRADKVRVRQSRRVCQGHAEVTQRSLAESGQRGLWTAAHARRGVAQIMLTSFNVRSLNVM